MSYNFQTAFRGVFFATICLLCCKKESNLHLLPTIEGAWAQYSPSPKWSYLFTDGILEQSIQISGQPIIQHMFPYAVRMDTVFIGGDSTNPPRKWLVDFLCDSVCQVTVLDVAISPTLILRRQ